MCSCCTLCVGLYASMCGLCVTCDCVDKSVYVSCSCTFPSLVQLLLCLHVSLLLSCSIALYILSCFCFSSCLFCPLPSYCFCLLKVCVWLLLSLDCHSATFLWCPCSICADVSASLIDIETYLLLIVWIPQYFYFAT